MKMMSLKNTKKNAVASGKSACSTFPSKKSYCETLFSVFFWEGHIFLSKATISGLIRLIFEAN